MKSTAKFLVFLCLGLTMASCVSKKKFVALRTQLEAANKDLATCGVSLNDYMTRLSTCDRDLKVAQDNMKSRQEQMQD